MIALQENSRKLVHIFTLIFAFLLPFLTPTWAFFLAFAAFVHNILLLPKYAPNIFRQQEHLLQGIAAYPLMVSILILMFPDQLVLVGGAWAILSWGDGFSSLFGRTWRIASLPWNPSKSLGGLLAFIVMGSVASFVLMCWIGPIFSFKHILFVAVLSSLGAALYESIPLPWDDNIIVALVAAIFLAIFWPVDIKLSEDTISAGWWGLSLLINVGIGSVAWFLRLVSTSGLLAGSLVGTLILAMGGPFLYILLVVYFVVATAATRVGYDDKEILGIAQDNRGQRGSKHALANGGLAVLAVVLLGMSAGLDQYLTIFYCAALATALGDTISSELGQVYGKQPFMPTSFRRVPPGTVGAISIEGTLFGIAATFIFAWLAWMLTIIPINWIPAITIGAWIGFYMESYIGAVWTDEGMEISNEWMNVLNTFIGGTVAIFIAFTTNAI